jgi:hypothetical protein
VKRLTALAVVGGVALAAFAGGRLVSGATPNVPSAFVPIVPCRLMDTRPGAENIGPLSQPLGPSFTHQATVWGPNGQCDIPSNATGVSMNVTALNGTEPSFLTLWPSDADARPNASNLNWLPGAPPTPNKVDVKLSANGKVSIFNRAGTVDVIVDIVGYYERVVSNPVGTLTVISVPIVIEPNTVGNGSNGSNTAECPSGMLAISGGVENSNGVAINVRSSRPNPVGVNPTGWFGDVRSPINASNETATVYAVCINP